METSVKLATKVSSLSSTFEKFPFLSEISSVTGSFLLLAVPGINLIDPQTPNYNRVLVFQILGVLVFQLLQKVPNTGLVAMTTTTIDCRGVSLPRQWLCQLST